MKLTLLKRAPVHIEHPEDVQRMRELLQANGYDASLPDIQWAWRSHSDDACAGWLVLSCFEDEEILDALLHKLHGLDS